MSRLNECLVSISGTLSLSLSLSLSICLIRSPQGWLRVYLPAPHNQDSIMWCMAWLRPLLLDKRPEVFHLTIWHAFSVTNLIIIRCSPRTLGFSRFALLSG